MSEMHDYREPSLPLSTEQFRHALHVGHGRAKMHLQRFGLDGLRDLVLEAAVACKVYDPQVEGLPAEWFADFCEAAELVPTLVGMPLAEAHWDRAWRFALLAQFALRKHVGAREALYDMCLETGHGELFGAEEIIDLDGAQGLLFVARKLGQMLLPDLGRELQENPIEYFDAIHGDGAALQILTPHSESDVAVAAYLQRVRTLVPARPEKVRERASVQETVRAILEAKQSLFGLTYWARPLSPSDLDPIRDLALSNPEPIILENSLRCLRGCKTLPLDTALFPLVRHSNPGVRTFAARTIGQHVSPLVRDLGVGLLAEDVGVALDLLRFNAVQEDVDAVLSNLQPLSDVYEQHDVASDVLDLVADSPIWDQRLALYVYEYSPCQNCRGSAVRNLLERRACPAWVLAEGRLDASEEIRELT